MEKNLCYNQLVNTEMKLHLQAELDQQVEFVTANTRLAISLRSILESLSAEKQSALSSNATVYRSPVVIPFQQWFEKLRNQFLIEGLIDARVILSPLAESVIWQRIVERSASGKLLLAPALAATEAQKAYKLLCEWQVDIDSHSFALSSQPEGEALLEWVRSFRQELVQLQYITHSEAQIELLDLLKSKFEHKNTKIASCHSQAHNRVQAVGFQSPTPLQLGLMQYFSGSKQKAKEVIDQPTEVDVNKFSMQAALLLTQGLSRHCEQVRIDCFEDFESELTAAAQWAKAIHQQQPSARVAIVMPDLESQSAVVNRIMRQQFEPQSLQAGWVSSASAYNISAGTPLAATPVVAIYLDVIQGVLHELNIEQWQAVLTSPLLCSDSDDLLEQRLLIEAMYASGEETFTLLDLPRVLQWWQSTSDIKSCSANKNFIDCLLRVIQQAQPLTAYCQRDKKLLPSVWLGEFSALLQTLNWLKARNLNSNEYQQQQRFNESCQNFASIDEVVGEIPASAALKLLRQHLMATVYHRQTVTDSEIPHVLGVLEASGLVFDHLWILGFSDAQWPSKLRPNALIPLSLQQSLAMPSCSEPREFEYIQKLTQSFLTAAKTVHISFPNLINDVATQLSPVVEMLLANLAQQKNSAANELPIVNIERCDLNTESTDNPDQNAYEKPQSDKTVLASTEAVEYIDDLYGEPILTNPSSSEAIELPGGTYRLKATALNPLRAYLSYRLGLDPLPARVKGITALERGIAVHNILEACWTELGDQQTLLKTTPEDSEQLINTVVEKVLPSLFARRFKPILPRLQALESSTLKNLIATWLTFESEREPFSVEKSEYKVSHNVGGLIIKGQIDRIDSLTDDSLLLIDYKSGATSKAGWLDGELTDPQLPFYACAIMENNKLMQDGQKALHLGGIAFAGLKPGNLSFKGIADDGSVTSNIADINSLTDRQLEVFTSWQGLQNHWSVALDVLVDKIKTGFAGIEAGSDFTEDPFDPIMRSACSSEILSVVQHSE